MPMKRRKFMILKMSALLSYLHTNQYYLYDNEIKLKMFIGIDS